VQARRWRRVAEDNGLSPTPVHGGWALRSVTRPEGRA